MTAGEELAACGKPGAINPIQQPVLPGKEGGGAGPSELEERGIVPAPAAAAAPPARTALPARGPSLGLGELS